jgi:hypothetical protein
MVAAVMALWIPWGSFESLAVSAELNPLACVRPGLEALGSKLMARAKSSVAATLF